MQCDIIMLNFSFNFNCTSGSRAVVIYSQAIANEIYFDEVVVWALGHRRVIALPSSENNPFANVIQCTRIRQYSKSRSLLTVTLYVAQTT